MAVNRKGRKRDKYRRDEAQRLPDKAQGLPVRRARVKAAREALAHYLPLMDENHIIDVVSEVGLFDCWKGYNERATGLVFDFTDLQMCAFAAAIVCAGELVEEAQ